MLNYRYSVPVRENSSTFDSAMETSHVIASKTAYLAGVPERHFYSEKDEAGRFSLDRAVFDALEKNNDAKILRCLTTLRTTFNSHFRELDNAMRFEMKNLTSLEDTRELVQALHTLGVELYKVNPTLQYYVDKVNELITARIQNVKALYPDWVRFEYVKNLFVFPDFAHRCTAYYNTYKNHRNQMPYNAYLHISEEYFLNNPTLGNLFYDDSKFLETLYDMNGDVFVCGFATHQESSDTRDTLDAFAAQAQRIDIVVDCENSDPVKLAAALESLRDNVRCKLNKVLLITDVHASSLWNQLSDYTDCPVEILQNERVLEHKSLSDVALTAALCKEHFMNQVDSFLLASSDSDFTGLVRSLSSARFMLMMERSKSSPAVRKVLEAEGVGLVCLDDFNVGHTAWRFQWNCLDELCQAYLQERMQQINVNSMISYALLNSRASLNEAEKAILRRKVNGLHVFIDPAGNVRLELAN